MNANKFHNIESQLNNVIDIVWLKTQIDASAKQFQLLMTVIIKFRNQ